MYNKNIPLFITHASRNLNYGAAKSLSYIINNYMSVFDVIMPIDPNININDVRAYLGINCRRVIITHMPFNNNIVYGNVYGGVGKDSIYRIFLMLFRKIFDPIAKSIINLYLRLYKYKWIYLNSLGLCDLITPNDNYILHVREVFRGTDADFERVSKKLHMAKKVIFIDYATYKPFESIDMDYMILNNPFDMTKVSLLDEESIYQKYNIAKEDVIYSILGVISPTKGVDFVVSSFCEVPFQNKVLFIVGRDDNTAYSNSIKKIVNDNSCKIIFTGDLVDPSEIYRISDYIIRGDDMFCIGRTVYEGLYSGCHVIIPCNNPDEVWKEFSCEYHSMVHPYMARNKESLINVINSGEKIIEKNYVSNVPEYLEKFHTFIER